jgi:exoribonuclease R
VQVGKKILRHFPTLSVLRRHPAPSRARFDTLIAAAKLRGFDIQVRGLDLRKHTDKPVYTQLHCLRI